MNQRVEMNQPSAKEIKDAFNEVFQCYDIAGARSQSILELIEKRKNKTTWVGSEEINLMFCVDEFLDEHSRGWRK